MIRWVTRLRQARADDRGLTLPELLVSIVIFGILGVATTLTVKASLDTDFNTTTDGHDLNDVQASVDVMSKLLATAAQPPVNAGGTAPNAIVSAGASDLTFYGYNIPGAGPSKIRFYVSGSSLIEQTTPATNCANPLTFGTTTTRTVANGLVSGQTLFTYYSAPSTAPYTNGTLLTQPTGSGTLSTANAGMVEEIGISLSVQQSTRVSPIQAATQVFLPNTLVAGSNLPVTAC